MIRTEVRIADLEFRVYQEDDVIKIFTPGSVIEFPKERAQDVIDAILVVDFAIGRQRAVAREKKA